MYVCVCAWSHFLLHCTSKLICVCCLVDTFKTPAPGTYSPEKVHPQGEKHAPAYSMGSRTRYRKRKNISSLINRFRWIHMLATQQFEKKNWPKIPLQSITAQYVLYNFVFSFYQVTPLLPQAPILYQGWLAQRFQTRCHLHLTLWLPDPTLEDFLKIWLRHLAPAGITQHTQISSRGEHPTTQCLEEVSCLEVGWTALDSYPRVRWLSKKCKTLFHFM